MIRLLPIIPDWPAPESVVSFVTTRSGGVSKTPYDSLNLAQHVGDQPDHVLQNRAILQSYLSEENRVQWLNQIHGVKVIIAPTTEQIPDGDALYTQEKGLACAVLTADCLPVLFCNQQGTEVAAAHAGWRGLLDGVLQATVAKFEDKPSNLMAWLGPAISQTRFEVGAEVRALFVERFVDSDLSADVENAFIESSREGHFMADLYALARSVLGSVGVNAVYGGGECSYSDPRFYSYRREAVTGRMVSVIMMRR